MAIRDFFKRVFGTSPQTGAINKSVPTDPTFWQSLRLRGGSGGNLDNPYDKSVWVYSSIRAISQNLGRVPFKVYKKGSPEDNPLERKQLTTGPLTRLLKKPNSFMTFKGLVEATSVFLELHGEAFWIMEGRKNITSMPTEIWTFDPTRFSAVIDNGRLTGWVYDKTGSGNDEDKVPFKLSEILYFRYFNPYDEVRGLAPLDAAQLSVDQDYFASEYNKNFFEEGAIPGGAVEVEEELSPIAYNRLLTQFEERHKGVSKANRVALLEGGAKWKDVGVNQKDIDFVKLKKVSREEIFAAYKTNAVVLGFYDDIKCWREDTQLMTYNGFKSVKDIVKGELVATFDPSTKKAHFVPVTNVYEYDYNGVMYTHKGTTQKKINFCVTPEHRFIGKDYKRPRPEYNDGLDPYGDFKFKRIRDIKNCSFAIPKNAVWDGVVEDTYDIGKRKFKPNNRNNVPEDGRKDTIFPMIPFLKFLGWFVSEGCYYSEQHYSLCISQENPEGRQQFEKDMIDFPYKINSREHDYMLSGKDLFLYLKENCGHYCNEKKLPRDIMNLHPSLLKHVFDAMMQGDGTFRTRGGRHHWEYTTTSPQLAKDVFEIGIKLGLAPSFYNEGEPKAPKNPNHKPYWVISFPSIEDSSKYATFKGVEELHHTGKVYCVEVKPYHTVLSLYKGKIMWVSQSYEGIRAAHRAFWLESLVPKITYIEDTINRDFLEKLSGSYIGEFDLGTVEALRDDYDRKIQTAWMMSRMGYPVNTINVRLNLGMPSLKWGDVWWATKNVIPIDSTEVPEPESKPEPDPKPDDPEDENTEDNENADKGKDKMVKKGLSIHTKVASVHGILEKRLHSKLSRFVFEQRKYIIEKIHQISGDYKLMTATDTINLVFPEDENKKLRDMMKGFYTTGIKIGAEMIADEVRDIDFIFKEADFEYHINARLNIIPDSIVLTVKRQLNQALIEGVDAGDSILELIERVKKVYNFTTANIKVIAKTEAIGAINDGRYIAMTRYSVPSHQWVYAGDDLHKELEGKTTKLGKVFENTDLRYPCDLGTSNEVGCNCISIPIKEETD